MKRKREKLVLPFYCPLEYDLKAGCFVFCYMKEDDENTLSDLRPQGRGAGAQRKGKREQGTGATQGQNCVLQGCSAQKKRKISFE